MRRRRILTGLLLALAAPLGTEAQQAGTVYRVGRLTGGTEPPSLEAFRQGLRELGWAVDQNLLIEARSAEGQPDRLPRSPQSWCG
jgi:hypothetical protein